MEWRQPKPWCLLAMRSVDDDTRMLDVTSATLNDDRRRKVDKLKVGVPLKVDISSVKHRNLTITNGNSSTADEVTELPVTRLGKAEGNGKGSKMTQLTAASQ